MSAGVNENKDPFDRQNAKGSVYDKIYFTDEELKRGQEILDQADKGLISRESAHNWWESTRAGHGYTGGEDGHGYTKLGQSSGKNAPTYVNQYKDIMDQAVGAVMGREKFSYDPATDPAYQQYADTYARMGQKAMDDTLGKVSARTGGLASSYATTAAQQTYDGYMAQLADKAPELRQLAYQMYQDEGSEQRQNLQILQNLEQIAYGRYQDELDQYNADRNYNYGVQRDQIEDERYDEKWQYGVDQDTYNREQDEKNAAREQIMQALMELGMSVDELDPKLAELAGYDDNMLNRLAQFYKDNQKPKASSGGGGGGPSMDWSDVESWVSKYGEDAAEDYIGEHYKALGYPSKSAAMSAWNNHLLETGSPAPVPNNNNPFGGVSIEEYDAMGGNYQEVAAHLSKMKASGTPTNDILAAIKDAKESGVLNLADYMRLYNQYRG